MDPIKPARQERRAFGPPPLDDRGSNWIRPDGRTR